MRRIRIGRRAGAGLAAGALAGVLASCVSSKTVHGDDIAVAVLGKGSGGGISSVEPTRWRAGVTIVDIMVTVQAFNADGTPCPTKVTDPGTLETQNGGCKGGRKIKYKFGPCEPPVKVVVTQKTTLSDGTSSTVSETKFF